MQRFLLVFFIIQLCFCFSWSVLGQVSNIKDSIILTQSKLIEQNEKSISTQYKLINKYENIFIKQEQKIKDLKNFTSTLFFVNISILVVLIVAGLLTSLGILDKYIYK